MNRETRLGRLPIYDAWPAPLVIAHERYAAAIARCYTLYREHRDAGNDELRCSFLADQIASAEREEDEAWETWEELYQLWMDGQL